MMCFFFSFQPSMTIIKSSNGCCENNIRNTVHKVKVKGNLKNFNKIFGPFSGAGPKYHQSLSNKFLCMLLTHTNHLDVLLPPIHEPPHWFASKPLSLQLQPQNLFPNIIRTISICFSELISKTSAVPLINSFLILFTP